MHDLAMNTSSSYHELTDDEINAIAGGGIGQLSGTKILNAVKSGAQNANSSVGAVIGAVAGGISEFVSELLA
jgi:outer membrane lipoprotein SlyB